jgi:hypothetical protein
MAPGFTVGHDEHLNAASVHEHLLRFAQNCVENLKEMDEEAVGIAEIIEGFNSGTIPPGAATPGLVKTRADLHLFVSRVYCKLFFF